MRKITEWDRVRAARHEAVMSSSSSSTPVPASARSRLCPSSPPGLCLVGAVIGFDGYATGCEWAQIWMAGLAATPRLVGGSQTWTCSVARLMTGISR
jgi:hypothetical protein